ncbi:hypothetical protein SEA_JONJAMES_102 [Gordonia Phage JonJames]|nr:hypothetical protein SEA_JONJAMES_102 [Gordonia Phage JonJames]
MRDIKDMPLVLESGSHLNGIGSAGHGCVMEMVSWLSGDDIPTAAPSCVDVRLACFMQSLNDIGLQKYGIKKPPVPNDVTAHRFRPADAHQVAEITRLGLKVVGAEVREGVKPSAGWWSAAEQIVRRSHDFDDMIRQCERFLDESVVPRAEEVREPRSGQPKEEKV